MKREAESIKEFKNGNINIKLSPDDLESAKRDYILTLADILSRLDCEFFGDTFCLSNFDTGHAIYNYYSNKVYIISWSKAERLKQGESLKLYATEPTPEVLETLERS